MYLYLIASIVASLALTGILLRIFIPVLKSVHLGQPISEIGPRWHKSKEGTPTLGGIAFIFAFVLCVCVISLIIPSKLDLPRLIITLATTVLFGVIGAIDDAAKLRKRENEGLTAPQKFLLQLVVSAAYVGVMAYKGYVSTVMSIPFTDIQIDFGFFYYIISVILICGIVNSVNLTDGIDGLAASTVAVVMAFFAVVGVASENNTVSLIACTVFGGCLGFLIYNAYPAKIFMGDTGSLFLGGMCACLAFLVDSPLIIICAGIVFIFETASVILQVSYHKITGKRLFKMAPFHHHLERCGWSENKIVAVAVMITVAACVLCAIFM